MLAPGRENGEYLLFCRERDKEKELWDGSRAGPAGAVERFGADDAFPIDDIDDILPGIMESCTRVYYTMGMYSDFDSRITGWVKSLRLRESRGVHTPQEFVALDHILHDMRLYKAERKYRQCARPQRSQHRRTSGRCSSHAPVSWNMKWRRNSYTSFANHAVGASQRHATDSSTAKVLGDFTSQFSFLVAFLDVHRDRVVDRGQALLGKFGVKRRSDNLSDLTCVCHDFF